MAKDRKSRTPKPRIPCWYCARMAIYPQEHHTLGIKPLICPASWKPWARLDLQAHKYNYIWIRYFPYPMNAYIAIHRTGKFQIIPPIAPFTTVPTRREAYNLIATQIGDEWIIPPT